MAVSNILNYAGIQISSAEIALTGGASNVDANWDTPAQLWDGGPDKRYIFWGDTTGSINIYEFNFSSSSAADLTLITNAGYSNAALTLTVKFGQLGTENVMIFPECVYNPGFTNRRLRALGDRLVLEGSTEYRILKINDF